MNRTKVVPMSQVAPLSATRWILWLLMALLTFGALDNAAAQNRGSRNARSGRGDDQSRRLDTTVTVERGTIVDVSAASGSITVLGWDRNEVQVRAESEFAELQFTKSDRSVRLEARRSNRARGGEVDMQLRVPLNTRVVVSTMLGDVQVLGVRGEVDADLLSGDIVIRGASGRTAITNVTGEITVSDVDGSLKVNTMSGGMTLNDIRGDVHAESNNGDVSMSGMRGNIVQVELVQGDISYDGTLSATGRYEFNTHSGDVHLYLGENAKGTVQLQSFNGKLHSSYPLLLLPDSSSRRPLATTIRQFNGRELVLNQPQRLQFGGGGGATISVSTFNGDVHISRGPRRQEKDK